MKTKFIFFIILISFINKDLYAQCNLPTQFPSTYQVLNIQNKKIAKCFAPIIHQMTNGVNGGFQLANALDARADLITSVYYDGNFNTGDNWESLDLYVSDLPSAYPELLPLVYYSVVWTDDSWIISYDFYHPRDYANSTLCCPDNHENDMEGAIFVVNRQTQMIKGAASISHEDIIYKSFNTSNVPSVFIDDGSHAVEIDIGTGCIDHINPCDDCKSFSDPHVIYVPSLDGNATLNLTELFGGINNSFVSGLTGSGAYTFEDIFGSDPESLANQRTSPTLFTGKKFFSEVLSATSQCQDQGEASAPWGWDQLEYRHEEIRLIECLSNISGFEGKGSSLFSLFPPISEYQLCVVNNSTEDVLYNPYFPPEYCYSNLPTVVDQVNISCPNNFYDLTNAVLTDVPNQNELVFRDAFLPFPPSESNLFDSPIVTKSGTYTAYFYNKFYNCYSPGALIEVNIEGCCPESDIVIDDLRYTDDFKNFGGDVRVINGGTLIIKGRDSDNDHHYVTVNQDKKIIVESGGTLIFEKGSSISQCHNASSWGGITIESGGYLFVQGETFPENRVNISGASPYSIEANPGSFISLNEVDIKESENGIRFAGGSIVDSYNSVNISEIEFNGLEVIGEPNGPLFNFNFSNINGAGNIINAVGRNGILAENVWIHIEDFDVGSCNVGAQFQDVILGTISNSNFWGNRTAISLLRSADVEIDNNIIDENSSMPHRLGIYSKRSFDVRITNNQIKATENCITSISSSLTADANNIKLLSSTGVVYSAIESLVSNDIYSNNYIDIFDGFRGIDMIFSDGTEVSDNDIESFIPGVFGINIRTGSNYTVSQNFISKKGNSVYARRAVNIENSNDNDLFCNILEAEREAIFVLPNSMTQDLDANIIRGETSLRIQEEIGIQEDKGNTFYKEDASLNGFYTAEGLSPDQIDNSRFIVKGSLTAQVPTPNISNLLRTDSPNTPEGCNNSGIGPNWDGLTPPGVVCEIVDKLDDLQTSNSSRYIINMIHIYRYYLMNQPFSEWPSCLQSKWNGTELCGIQELVYAQKSFTELIYMYQNSNLHNHISTQQDGENYGTTLTNLNNNYQNSINFQLAETENFLNNIECNDQVISVWQDILLLFVKYIRGQAFTQYEVNTLQNVGELCSQEYGDPVNWADLMYTHTTESYLTPATNCGQQQNLIFSFPSNNVTVSPNPTTGLLNVHIPSEYQNLEYSLYDNTGILVKQGTKNGEKDFSLDLEQEQRGLYILRLSLDGKKEVSKKVVLIR